MPAPYLSELKFLGYSTQDFIEVAVDAGSSVANIQVVVYGATGLVRSTNSLGSVGGTVAGKDVYVLRTWNSPTFDGLAKDGGVALVVDGVVTQFVSFDSQLTPTVGPASGMTSTKLGSTGAGASRETSDNGATYQIQYTPTPNTVPCFVCGTRILTSQGYRPIEDLDVGELVWTEDDGLQPILWAGSKTQGASHSDDLATAPVRIPAHSMGPDAPMRDVWVSPNHRIALSHATAALYFQSYEVFTDAKSLLGYRGIEQAQAGQPVVYHHIALARHQILRAEGLASESFLPAKMGVEALNIRDRAALLAALPGPEYGPTARVTLKTCETRVLMAAAGEDSLDLSAQDTARQAA